MQPTRGGDDGGGGKGTSSSGKGNSGKDTRILVVPPVTTPGQTYSGASGRDIPWGLLGIGVAVGILKG